MGSKPIKGEKQMTINCPHCGSDKTKGRPFFLTYNTPMNHCYNCDTDFD
jgi:uncharacterized protein (DUF983 family)